MPVHWLAFNQDNSCLGVGLETSYAVYNCEPFGESFSKADDGGASIVEMLFSTTLIASVGLGYKLSSSSRKLKIVNTKRGSVICELTFPTVIKWVKMNRKRLVVAIEKQIFIYDVSCMKLLHTLDVTSSSGRIIATLSPSDSSTLAFQFWKEMPNGGRSSSSPEPSSEFTPNQDSPFPESTKMGTVVLFDALNLRMINVIECHRSLLQKIALSPDGTLFATASVKGTIVRVFSVATGRRLYEFRRGSYSAHISSLSFNSNNSVLACSSNTGTVHLFQLDLPPAQSEQSEQSAEEGSESSQSPEPAVPASSLPSRSVMTDEESLEIDRLINSRLGSSDGESGPSVAHAFFSRGKKSTKKIGKFLWSQSKSYMPPQFNSIVESKRDFAFIKLNTEVDSVVAVVGTSCYVATYDGDFLVYKLPSSASTRRDHHKSQSSEECVLLKQYKFFSGD